MGWEGFLDEEDAKGLETLKIFWGEGEIGDGRKKREIVREREIYI